MISVQEAKNIIENSVQPLEPVKCLLADAWDTILAEDVYASQDIPAYPQSSMDGYAFNFNDLKKHKSLAIAGESAAGNRHPFLLSANTASRIFTGAAVPEGADTVVMQEKVKVTDGHLIIEDEMLLKGTNVRDRGSEIKKGELALSKGSYVSAAAVGFLAGIGITDVLIYPKPSITIIVTGNELKDGGEQLEYGEVYESNSYAISAALKQFHFAATTILKAPDDPLILRSIMQTALHTSDVLLLTGGVSVGEYDFVSATAKECGVTTLFHKIKQRPGKPLFFGMKDKKVVFGLPGNPSSVLTCLYEYVLPALNKMSKGIHQFKSIHAPLSVPFKKTIPFTQFLKGYYDGTAVLPLAGQESYKMNSFAKSNCLIVLEEKDEQCNAGDIKEIHLII
jgi:molybdopterin molybdotransferase